METFTTVLAKLLVPFFYPTAPAQRIYFVYLASALLLALLVYLAARGRRSDSLLKGFFAYCFPRSVYAHKSAIVDYKYFIINKIAFPFFFAPLIVGSALVSDWTVASLQPFWDGPGREAGIGAALLFTGLTVLVMDAGIFAAHYLQHKVPALWEFHKVHHSAEVMTPITVYRMHPVDDLLSGTFVGLLTGAVHGVFALTFADGVGAITVLEVNLLLFVYYVAGYNLRHSHIWLPYPRLLSHILISPAQHQIHHSKLPRHFDKNIGFIFAFWDWMAGTLYVPRGKEDFGFGLDGDEHKDFDSVWSLYILPFRNLVSRLRGRQSSRA